MGNKKKILIPGGTGFIGYHLCLFFKKKNWVVHSVSKTKPKANRRIKGIKYIYCDVTDRKNLKKKLHRYYDYIVNLSGYVDHSKSKSIKKVHFDGCKNLVFNFQAKRPKKFIQIGSSIEYGKLRSPNIENNENTQKTFSVYGKAKLMSTKYLLNLKKKFDFPVTILRPYLIYGPRQDLNRIIPIVITNAIDDKIFDCSDGKQLRDFLYIDDFVEAIYKSLINKKNIGEIVNVGYGKPTKIKNVIIKICKIIGSGTPKFGKIKLRKDETYKLYPDISKARRLLKWKPKIKLNLGLKRTIKFYKQSNEKKS